jgi:hypothetical protein
MRCGNWIVSLGANEAEVESKCGPPSTAERRVAESRRRGRTRRATLDTWTYDRGRNEFIRTLTFENLILKNIEVGGYGR